MLIFRDAYLQIKPQFQSNDLQGKKNSTHDGSKTVESFTLQALLISGVTWVAPINGQK